MIRLGKRWSGLLRPSSIGIEITDSTVKITEVMVHKNGKPHLLSSKTEPLPVNTVQDGKIVSPLKVIQTLQSLAVKMDLSTQKVHLAIPSHSVMLRYLKLPDIPAADLKKVIDFEIKHNIHVPFDEPVYDFIKLNGVNHTRNHVHRKVRKPLAENFEEEGLKEAAAGDGPADNWENNSDEQAGKAQSDVLLVAAPKELIDQYCEVIKTAGLTLCSIEIKAFSLCRFIEAARLAKTGGTFLAVDIDNNLSDLSIYHNGQLKINRSVPIVFGSPINEPELARTAINDLAHEIERLMNFYRYSLNNRSQEFSEIIVTGDVPQINEVAEYLKERLSLGVRVPGLQDVQAANDEDFDVPGLAVSIGLALRGGKR